MVDTCEFCGAKIVYYVHRLNKPLCSAMIKIYSKYKFSPCKISEELSHAQVCNFQKLKYWGFVEKTKSEGYWVLTPLAEAFIKSQAPMYNKVKTFRGNRVTFEGECIYVHEIIEGYQWRQDYVSRSS
jgi:hypothetical protein